MKLTVGYRGHSDGFALPTILLVATVMLIVLTASIAATAASRVSLDSQFYNQLAEQAAQSGLNRANECLKSNGYAPQWSTNATGRDLRPNSDCSGMTMSGSHVSQYVVDTTMSSRIHTRYTVDAPNDTGIGSVLKVIGITELMRTSSPNTVWRSYEQVLYLRIEPPKTVACPSGFIAVPGDARFNTSDFCVGKYEAKDVGGRAVSRAEGTPWVNINQPDAIKVAADACNGCSLINEAQWMTIAHNVANVSGNWSGGSVGSGYVFSGHNDNVPANSLAASSDDSDGYNGTGNSTGNQRRTLRLNNGETVWDFSGNVFEWTTGQIGSGKPGASGGTYRQWNAVTGTGSGITPSPFPAFGTPAASGWTSTQGIGMVWSNSDDTATRAFRRGGSWAYGQYSGIFNLSLDAPVTYAEARIGFRLVYNPLSSTSCPSGQVLVPGNNTFGTKNFCVGKYETKNVGGVPTSQAAGVPWVNISQTDAISVASNACGSCRLISEAEWLTVAHNVANVPSNWSGGSVGSGYIYSGHNDNSPYSILAASNDDSSGYSGTGQTSGNQRRTLKLNTGETVWDLAGNTMEWTTGLTNGGQPGDAGYAWREWNAMPNAGSLSPNPFPSYGTSAASAWSSSNGIGRALTDSSNTGDRPFIRGGSRADGSNAGIFMLHLSAGSPASAASTIGFRVTSDPIVSISCSGGMIPVPGDSRFGTSDFCVGKYEAKNVGGVATSQAAGLPWSSINQASASAAASAACAKCRLIGEAEWLTIAHNVVNVPSNWSSGVVGSGYIYSGHGDNGPAGAIEASTNDNDGYFNTGNVSGNQRRTLSLSNGQVIWDLAGNVYEWTSAQINGPQPGPGGWTWREWRDVADTGAFVPNPFPAYGTPAASGWTSANGIGRFYSNSSESSLRGYRRGGYWYHDGTSGNQGIFQLALNLAPTDTASALGFRVVEIK